MGETRSDILQGTLDLMVLKTLNQMGPLHGYGLALRIEQISEDALRVRGPSYLSYPSPQRRNRSDTSRTCSASLRHCGRAAGSE